MKVRCKSNRGEDLVPPYYDPQIGRPNGHRFALTIGRSYVVYALGFGDPGTWVYIADDVFVDGPRRYPLCLFEIEDDSVSQTWSVAFERRDADQARMLAPRKWLEMKWFFNRVVDGDADAVAAFAEMKQAIDEE
jgi:hypothetical protein